MNGALFVDGFYIQQSPLRMKGFDMPDSFFSSLTPRREPEPNNAQHPKA